MARTPTLKVDIEAGTARLKRDMAKNTRTIQNSSKKMNKSLATVTKAFAAIGSAVAIGAALKGIKSLSKAITKLITEIAAAGDLLSKTAQRTGLSTAMLQELEFAAGRSGAAFTDLTKGVKNLSKTMLDAQWGLSTAVDVFEELGIAFEDDQKKMRDFWDVFIDLSRAIKDTENPAKRLALALKALGKAGESLMPLLLEGPKGIQALRDRFNELHGEMSEGVIKGSVAYTDALLDMQTAWKGFKSTLADTGVLDAAATALTTLADAIAAMNKNMKELNVGLPELMAKIGGMMRVIGGSIPLLGGLTNVFGELIEVTGQSIGKKAEPVMPTLDEMAALLDPLHVIKKAPAVAGVTESGWEKAGRDAFQRFNRAFWKPWVTKDAIKSPFPAVDPLQEYKDIFGQRTDSPLQWYVESATNAQEEVEHAFVSSFQNMENAMVNFFMTGKAQWADFARAGIADFLQVLVRTQITGRAAGFVSGLFHPEGRAGGGPVTTGRPYIVGERGPELFSPGQSGSIAPNGAGVNFSMTVVTPDAESFRQSQSQIAADMLGMMQRAAATG